MNQYFVFGCFIFVSGHRHNTIKLMLEGSGVAETNEILALHFYIRKCQRFKLLQLR